MGTITFRIDDHGTDAILHSIPTDKPLKVEEAIRVEGQVFFKTADGKFYSTVVQPTARHHYSCGAHFHRIRPTLKALGKLGFLDARVIAKWLRERDAANRKEDAQRDLSRLKEQAALLGFKLTKSKP